MTVNPFWFGVLCTISAELLALVIAVIIGYTRK